MPSGLVCLPSLPLAFVRTGPWALTHAHTVAGAAAVAEARKTLDALRASDAEARDEAHGLRAAGARHAHALASAALQAEVLQKEAALQARARSSCPS